MLPNASLIVLPIKSLDLTCLLLAIIAGSNTANNPIIIKARIAYGPVRGVR